MQLCLEYFFIIYDSLHKVHKHIRKVRLAHKPVYPLLLLQPSHTIQNIILLNLHHHSPIQPIQNLRPELFAKVIDNLLISRVKQIHKVYMEAVPLSEGILQLLCLANAFKLPFADDSYPIAKGFCFLHEMGGKDDRGFIFAPYVIGYIYWGEYPTFSCDGKDPTQNWANPRKPQKGSQQEQSQLIASAAFLPIVGCFGFFSIHKGLHHVEIHQSCFQ